MAKNYVSDQEFKNENFTIDFLTNGEYDNCHFLNCNFASGDLSEIVFVDCSFENCDLSNAKLRNTSFQNAEFEECKLLGLRFEESNPFLFAIKCNTSVLNFSSFYKMSLKNTALSNCQLQDVDFTEADCSLCSFEGSDCLAANFFQTNLQGADFRSAINFSIDPTQNRVKKAKFSRNNLHGLLHSFSLVIES
ncbi:MAG: pentapeptide repeat-containing protein [Crocinitomicaceae bacterium]|jgi:fluoroquinolone resistance protein|nr:pentapeptide repeat-containing protein [Crocinitomicaceae bacterium]MDP4684502.1 pentapeptide repeat-containing protein [Crocinitomicaceae bacterium]MDP4865351.1 pentapeptide repeat-containing protein [Crocinitomicaceae bacterium]MDP5011677.1 pentapeptide repeat-containing protein [Crocinitomicaceae bacterium]MDP5098413.1 pentapeptide repeat-containing protein [Crocinitomicaceae bacterium]